MTMMWLGICLVVSVSQQAFSFSLFFRKKPTDIWEAFEKNDLESFKYYISQVSPSVNLTTEERENLLHKSCEKGYLEMCKLLLEKGVNKEALGKEGLNPLHSACFEGHGEVCELLLEKRANIEAQCKDGWVPLHFACSEGHGEVCKLLLEKGANIEAQDMDGRHSTLDVQRVMVKFVSYCWRRARILKHRIKTEGPHSTLHVQRVMVKFVSSCWRKERTLK